jgi:nicotinamidase-related amidase
VQRASTYRSPGVSIRQPAQPRTDADRQQRGGAREGGEGVQYPYDIDHRHRGAGGYLLKGIQDVFPTQKPINRTFINTWEDQRVVEAVKKTGRKQLVIAALWTEICLAMPVIQSLADGYEVFFVTDASGGVSREAHDMAVLRMVQAGAVPITWIAVMSEWQRDWAREATIPAIAEITVAHGGASGVAFAWEQQLLNSEKERRS